MLIAYKIGFFDYVFARLSLASPCEPNLQVSRFF